MPENFSGASTVTPSTEPKFTIIEPGTVARNLWFLRQAVIAAYEDNCFGIAKGAAYSLLLSLFPLLTTLTWLLLQMNAGSVVRVISDFLVQIVPPGTEDMVLSRLRAHGAKAVSLSILAVLLAIWAGSGAMASLIEGFQAAYRIPSGRPFLKQRAMAIFLEIVAAIPAVGASFLLIIGDRGEVTFIHWLGVSDVTAPLELTWRLARYILAFSTTTFVTALLYYFGPNHRPEPAYLTHRAGPRFLRVWPGAVVATGLWMVTTAGFAWYVGHFANYNIFYGSIGAVVVLLIWLYLIACIALLGCEFNAERERSLYLPAAT